MQEQAVSREEKNPLERGVRPFRRRRRLRAPREHHGAVPQPGHPRAGGGVVPLPPPLLRALFPRRERGRRRDRAGLSHEGAVRARAAQRLRHRRDLVHRAEFRQGPRDGAPGAAARAGGRRGAGRPRRGDRGGGAAHRLRSRHQGRGRRLAAALPRAGPGRADRPPGAAEHGAAEHPGRAADRRLLEPAGARARVRQRLPLLQHHPLLRQDLHLVPRDGARDLRERCAHRRRARHGHLLRDGRELPQGHRPRPGAAGRDGARAALLPVPDLLVGRGDPGLRPGRPGAAGRELHLDGGGDQAPGGELHQERGRGPEMARAGAARPRDQRAGLGDPLHGAPHAGEHPGGHRPPGRPGGGLHAVHAADAAADDRALPGEEGERAAARGPAVRGVARAEDAQLPPPALSRRLGRALDQAGVPPGVRRELQLDLPGHGHGLPGVPPPRGPRKAGRLPRDAARPGPRAARGVPSDTARGRAARGERAGA